MSAGAAGSQGYERPTVVDFGSIVDHTFTNLISGHSKQATGVFHLDWKCETSEGSGDNRCGTR